MRLFIRTAFAALVTLVFACNVQAQATPKMTAITAASIKMGGQRIATGNVTFTPVDSKGFPIPFVGAGGLNSTHAFSCPIVVGALSGCQIPDAALTTPANISYSIQIMDSVTHRVIIFPAVPNITGASWALDAYAPPANTTNVEPIQVSYGTASPPSPCASPSFYIQNLDGGLLYMCVAGSPVLVTGSGGGGGGTGPVGPAGPTGPKGDTGAQGLQGVPGATGATGSQGLQGVKGDTGSQGAPGATGATGAAGTSATIAVGTVTPLAAGATPTITNAGTPLAGVFNFGIPAGAQGVKGDTGSTGTQGIQGMKGDTGATGTPGTTGAAGSAATVTVGTVNTGAAGSSAIVTNRGTSSAAILDFTIPQGIQGSGGGTGGGLASFTVSNLSPLFTASLGATPLTNPALTFTASTAAQGAVLAGPASGGTGPYGFRALAATDVPLLNQSTTGTALNLSGSQSGNSFYASPNGVSGVGSWRRIVAQDLPALPYDASGAAAAAQAAAISSAVSTAVQKTGSTMTGPLLLSADPSVALGAATKQYVDNHAGGSSFITSLTTIGTSGAATVSGGVLNVPQYTGGGSSGPSMVVPRDRGYKISIASPNNNGFQNLGLYNGNSTGFGTMNTSPDSAGYDSVGFKTAGAAKVGVGFVSNNNDRFANNPSMRVIGGLPSTANIQNYFGMASFCGTSVANGDVTAAAVAFVGFRYFSASDGSNWQAYIGNGSAFTVMDTGVAVSTTHLQVFDVVYVAGAPQFFIDGVRVASSISLTNQPASGENMGVIAVVASTTTAVATENINTVYYGHN